MQRHWPGSEARGGPHGPPQRARAEPPVDFSAGIPIPTAPPKLQGMASTARRVPRSSASSPSSPWTVVSTATLRWVHPTGGRAGVSTLCGGYCHIPISQRRKQAQKGLVTCPSSHSKYRPTPGLKSRYEPDPAPTQCVDSLLVRLCPHRQGQVMRVVAVCPLGSV